jgi:transposase
MRKNGFRFKQGDKYGPLRERANIGFLRLKHIRNKVINRLSDNPLEEIYLDESYVHQYYASDWSWYHDEDGDGINHSIGKGHRYIIVAAGGAKGWVAGSQLVFRASDSKSEDYHTNMNNTVFIKWFTEMLLPNLRGPSLLIMDNASYHSCKQYNLNTMSKDELRDLLLDYKDKDSSIQYSNEWKKDELKSKLMPLVPKSSIIEELAEQKGHRVLWLPPYHPELNPIERMWGVAKQHVASTYNNKSDKIQLIDRMKAGLDKCTPRVWTGTVNRTMKSEKMLLGGEDEYAGMCRIIKQGQNQVHPPPADTESDSDSDMDMDSDIRH